MARSRGKWGGKCTDDVSASVYARLFAGTYTSTKTSLSSAQDMEVARLSQDKYVTAVVLLVGAPPPAASRNNILEFGEYIGELSMWTTQAKAALLDFWGISEDEYDDSILHRRAFDRCIEKWYTLNYEERK